MGSQSHDPANNIAYTAYPFQVLEYPSGVILRRGDIQILIEGEDGLSTVLIILTLTSGSKSTIPEILIRFPEFRRVEVKSLLEELIKKRFLFKEDLLSNNKIQDESTSDVFYWQLNKRPGEVSELIGKKPIAIVGINKLSLKIRDALEGIGIDDYDMVDYGPLRGFSVNQQNNIKKNKPFDDWKNSINYNTIVIGSMEFGGQALLLELNEWCVQKGISFLPIVIDHMKAFIGPLVIPHQTACLQCLRSRQNAHLHNISLERFAENFSNDGQEVAANHPSLINVAAEITAFEIIRAFGNLKPNYHPSLIEVDLLNGRMLNKRVLKIPRCKICSNFNRTTAIKTMKTTP